MDASISFVLDGDVAGFRPTAGLLPSGDMQVPGCALQVGDTVTLPNHRNRVYRVVSRHCNVDADLNESDWLVRLEPVRSGR